ncbi:MAG: hypothetical protein J7K51_09345 [Thermotogae bacterium]|nr:hypothetical protein [Thermotogota bacterium]
MINKRFNILIIILLSFLCISTIRAQSPFENIGETYSDLIREYESTVKVFKGYIDEDTAKNPIQKTVYYTLNQMNDIAYYNLIRNKVFGVSRQEGESVKIIDIAYLMGIVFKNRPYHSPLFDISYAAFLVHLKNSFKYEKDSSGALESSTLFSNMVSSFQNDVKRQTLSKALESITPGRGDLALRLSSKIEKTLKKKNREEINPEVLSFLENQGKKNTTIAKEEKTDMYSPFIHMYLSLIATSLKNIKNKLNKGINIEINNAVSSLEDVSVISNVETFKQTYNKVLSSIYLKSKIDVMKERQSIKKELSIGKMKGEIIQAILSSYKKDKALDWWHIRWFVYLIFLLISWFLSFFVKTLRGKIKYVFLFLFVVELISFSTSPYILRRGIEVTLYGITVVSLAVFAIIIWLKKLFSSRKISLKMFTTLSILISLFLMLAFPIYKDIQSLKLERDKTFRQSEFYEILKDDAYRSSNSSVVQAVNHIKSLLTTEHNELYKCSFNLPLSQLNTLGRFNGLESATLTGVKGGKQVKLMIKPNINSTYFSYDNVPLYMEDIGRSLRTLKTFDMHHKSRIKEVNNLLKSMVKKVKKIYMYGDKEIARGTSDYILTSFSTEDRKSLYVEIFKRLLPYFNISSHAPEISFSQVEWGVKAFIILCLMLVISILCRNSIILRLSSYITGFAFSMWVVMGKHTLLKCLTLYSYPVYITSGKAIHTTFPAAIILLLTLIPLIDIILDVRKSLISKK